MSRVIVELEFEPDVSEEDKSRAIQRLEAWVVTMSLDPEAHIKSLFFSVENDEEPIN